MLAMTSVESAESMDSRLCNIQGREIALRISEEDGSELTASERSRIARIAEEVCIEFTVEAGATQNSNLAVVESSSSARVDSNTGAASGAEPLQEPEAVEEEGQFGDLRIIKPEDRVQRPGLKRP